MGLYLYLYLYKLDHQSFLRHHSTRLRRTRKKKYAGAISLGTTVFVSTRHPLIKVGQKVISCHTRQAGLFPISLSISASLTRSLDSCGERRISILDCHADVSPCFEAEAQAPLVALKGGQVECGEAMQRAWPARRENAAIAGFGSGGGSQGLMKGTGQRLGTGSNPCVESK